MTSNFTYNFPLISENLHEKFLPKYVKNLFKRLFPVSSKLPSHFFEDFQIFFNFFCKCYTGFSNFFIFAKFLPRFLQTILKFLCIPKFRKKNSKYSTFSKFFFNFFKNDNKLKLHYEVCEVPSRKLEVFLKFH